MNVKMWGLGCCLAGLLLPLLGLTTMHLPRGLSPAATRNLPPKPVATTYPAAGLYVHDLVTGVEDLRTTVDTAIFIEKHVRGSTAGFNTPTFVVDAPGGGGKRDAHSYEHYDRETGISVCQAPSVKPGQFFMYFDPLHQLSTAAQRRWADPSEHDQMIGAALSKAKERVR